MSAFGGLILTNVGRNLQAKVQTGAQLNFTRIAIGDGDLGGSSILDLTALKHLVKSCSITKLKTMTGGKAVVGTSFSNQDIVSGFYWKELGVFAQDPDLGEILYCYGNSGANAEYIPAGGGADIIEKSIDVVTLVGNASNVTATMDSSLVYVTVQDFGAAFDPATGHKHTGAAGDAPQIGSSGLAAGAATDTVIGSRTADPALANPSSTGTLTQLLSWLAGRIKAITGKANWYDAPDITLASLSAHKARHATGGADALAPADIGAAAQVDFAAHLAESAYQTATGSDVIVITTGGDFTYTQGNPIKWIQELNNTGAVTINVDAKGAKGLKNPDGTDMAAGDLEAGNPYEAFYSLGDDFFILRPRGAKLTGDAVELNVLSGKTFYSNDPKTKLTGTMPNKVGSGTIITPSNVDQAIPQGYYGGALGDGKVPAIAPIVGDAVFHTNSTTVQKSAVDAPSPTLSKSTTYHGGSGNIRVKYTAWSEASVPSNAKARLYKNDVAVGANHSLTSAAVVYSDDITVNDGDLIQVYLTGASGGYTKVQALQLCCGISFSGTTNL